MERLHPLEQSEGDHPAGIRDRALLLLLATYGLRAGEVVRLRLENLDWEHETLTVGRSKTYKTQTYPLCRTVATPSCATSARCAPARPTGRSSCCGGRRGGR